mmetsp:Transcript_35223/g.36629  ORF Transcript_35223/g.36629 Transcript_35223/m.36629 type:complete len:125 (-) Transcript_35223:7-381(-)
MGGCCTHDNEDNFYSKAENIELMIEDLEDAKEDSLQFQLNDPFKLQKQYERLRVIPSNIPPLLKELDNLIKKRKKEDPHDPNLQERIRKYDSLEKRFQNTVIKEDDIKRMMSNVGNVFSQIGID